MHEANFTSGSFGLIACARSEADHGLFDHALILKQDSYIALGLGIVGLDCDRLVVARQRLLGPLQFLQHDAAVVEGLGIVGLDRDRLVVARQCLLECFSSFSATPRLLKASAYVGLERDRPVVARQRLLQPPQLLQRNAAVVEGLRKVGIDRDRLVIARQRFVKPLQFLQGDPPRLQYAEAKLRIYLQRNVDFAKRLSVIAALMINDTEQVQTVKMMGCSSRICR